MSTEGAMDEIQRSLNALRCGDPEQLIGTFYELFDVINQKGHGAHGSRLVSLYQALELYRISLSAEQLSGIKHSLEFIRRAIVRAMVETLEYRSPTGYGEKILINPRDEAAFRDVVPDFQELRRSFIAPET